MPFRTAHIRNILGQVKCKVNIPFTMNADIPTGCSSPISRRANLANDKANLLGSLLVTQFQLAAMARASLPEEERRDFFLFIDEFQNFSTEAFVSILSEARKYHLCLILSHKFIGQLLPPVQQAVLENVGTLICFHVGHTDAAVMEKAFGIEIRAQQLVDLGRHEIAVRLTEYGQNRVPFQGKTRPPL